MRESPRVFCVSRRDLVQEEGRPFTPTFGPLRLSRIVRKAETTTDPDAIPLRRALLWALFGVALVLGLVMYFKFERVVVPLLT